MFKDDDWIAVLISKAQEAHTSVTTAVSIRIKELLMGQLSERQLRQKELTEIADTIIAIPVPAEPKAVVGNED